MQGAGDGEGRAGMPAWPSFFGFAGRSLGGTLATAITIGALSGCQTTAEHSAELEKSAKHVRLALQGVSVRSENPSVGVTGSTVVRSSAGTAVVVMLHNSSKRALVNAPIEIAVRDAKGGVLFQNNQPGTDPALAHVSLIEPGATTLWVDDQVQAAGAPASASALVGQGEKAPGSVPRIGVSGTKESGEGEEASASGTVANLSKVVQQHLVVYVVARRSGRIVAAGRAVLPEVQAGASIPFQAYFVGDPRGAKIEAIAPPTTF
ncbi:MAG TPA: hypothetical protein VK672_00380 [Solirubrobacteraceae bacterium]|jgi:hypothetical protein|nr:hypothetical protein [Solirubrobacteraceae bacterium]